MLRTNTIENVAGTKSVDIDDMLDYTTAMQTPFSHRNKLINGDFGIWQRGTSNDAGTGEVYVGDRWLQGGVANRCLSIAYVDATFGKAARFNNLGVGVDLGYVVQMVELSSVGFNDYKKEDLVFSIYIRCSHELAAGTISPTFNFRDGNSGVVTSVPNEAINNPISSAGFIRYSWKLFTKDLTINAACDNLRVGITLPADTIQDWFIIANAQLEEGSVVTPFEDRPVAYELSLCQRYYEFGAENSMLASAYHPNYSVSPSISFKATKRHTAGSLVLTNIVSFSNVTGYDTMTTINSTKIDDNSFTFVLTGGTVADGATARIDFDWTLDAEL